jgi:6-phosphogluconolactonase
MEYNGSLIVSPSKAKIPIHLNRAIADVCVAAIASRGVFTIALSGGSLPSFLATVLDAFDTLGADPKFDSWFVILADERCVKSHHPDSNLGALQTELFTSIPVPKSQIYGINEDKLEESTDAVAKDYEIIVSNVLERSGGQLDLAVLGFGPDGHTCSLFPGHALLKEERRMVAPIEDSPKPPLCRITLTFPVLNTMTRHIIFCGAGESKAPVLQAVFDSVTTTTGDTTADGGRIVYRVAMRKSCPYPCGRVLPNTKDTENTLLWIVDKHAMDSVSTSFL